MTELITSCITGIIAVIIFLFIIIKVTGGASERKKEKETSKNTDESITDKAEETKDYDTRIKSTADSFIKTCEDFNLKYKFDYSLESIQYLDQAKQELWEDQEPNNKAIMAYMWASYYAQVLRNNFRSKWIATEDVAAPDIAFKMNGETVSLKVIKVGMHAFSNNKPFNDIHKSINNVLENCEKSNT